MHSTACSFLCVDGTKGVSAVALVFALLYVIKLLTDCCFNNLNFSLFLIIKVI